MALPIVSELFEGWSMTGTLNPPSDDSFLLSCSLVFLSEWNA